MNIAIEELENQAVQLIEENRLYEAIELLRSCVALSGEHNQTAYFMNWLATVYELSSNIVSARETLLEAIQIDSNPWSKVHLAKLEAKHGDVKRAKAIHDELLKVDGTIAINELVRIKLFRDLEDVIQLISLR